MKGNYQNRDFLNPYLMDKRGVLDLISQLQSKKKNLYNSRIKSSNQLNRLSNSNRPKLTKKIVLEDAWERLDEIEEAALKESEDN